jgi:hypothetical protein
LAGWRTIFLLTAGVQIVSVMIFVIFGRTSVQPWNTYWEESEKKDEKCLKCQKSLENGEISNNC